MQPSFPPLIWVGHFYLLNLEPSRFIPIISHLGFSGTNGAIDFKKQIYTERYARHMKTLKLLTRTCLWLFIASLCSFGSNAMAIEKRGLKSIGEPVWARYDPPFMPWFLRRNEVLIPVER
jgi:hypothetical protein